MERQHIKISFAPDLFPFEDILYLSCQLYFTDLIMCSVFFIFNLCVGCLFNDLCGVGCIVTWVVVCSHLFLCLFSALFISFFSVSNIFGIDCNKARYINSNIVDRITGMTIFSIIILKAYCVKLVLVLDCSGFFLVLKIYL